MGSGDPGGYRAIFLDRDGVINRNVRNPATGEDESPLTVEGFSLLPGVMPALRSLRTAGYQLFLVSNQPNHAKGKASLATLDAIHYKFLSHLMWERIEFEAFYYCLHHPQGVVAGYSGACVCRKPLPYFLFEAQRSFALDLRRSWMVGDRMTDVECGAVADHP
jgi:D-glycero-D-manno-heptose 1,7-bisphosphate phosphatase